jgi:hypothetical protein
VQTIGNPSSLHGLGFFDIGDKLSKINQSIIHENKYCLYLLSVNVVALELEVFVVVMFLDVNNPQNDLEIYWWHFERNRLIFLIVFHPYD